MNPALRAVKEYQEGTYLQNKATLQSEIKRAQINLATTSDHVEEVRRLFEKGTISKTHKVAAELSLQDARFTLELADNKLHTLENSTRPNTILNLRGEVEGSRSREQAAKEILELRRDQAQRARKQIEHCRIIAPCDGRVVSIKPPDGVRVNEGDQVYERQLLLSLTPPKP